MYREALYKITRLTEEGLAATQAKSSIYELLNDKSIYKFVLPRESLLANLGRKSFERELEELFRQALEEVKEWDGKKFLWTRRMADA